MQKNDTNTAAQHERIERFLQGAMGDKERTELELDLLNDADFAREVEVHQTLKRTLKELPANEWEPAEPAAPKPGWLHSLWHNTGLAWVTAVGCAAALMLSVALSPNSETGFTISDELAIHSYRGQSSPAIENVLSTRAEGTYLLLTIDTPHTLSEATLSMIAAGKTAPFVSIDGKTDDMGTLTLAVASARIPAGSVSLNVRHENGASNEWLVTFR